jgi:hypothetical protein
MPRVLDLDLDFFVHGVAHFRDFHAGRLDDNEFPAWDVDKALAFLRERCGLTGRLPGVVVEHHGELFGRWRDAIETGRLAVPFSVTHVDAHADLGLGDAGYVDLLTRVVHQPLDQRRDPGSALGDGNFLAFAAACRWLSDLTYVYNHEGGGNDVMSYVMENFDSNAAHVRLPALTKAQLEQLPFDKPQPAGLEPPIRFAMVSGLNFQASEPLDVICLCRSPAFTPPAADAVFSAIRKTFIDETAF